MAMFLVTPLANNAAALGPAIDAAVDAADRYPLANSAGWLIDFKGTTVELSNHIGITGLPAGEKSKLGSALVTPLTSYYGIGSTDMWEWLKIRFERT